MLRGSHLATVDEKGRVKIPAEYLAELRRHGKQFYVTSENGDHARVYPMGNRANRRVQRRKPTALLQANPRKRSAARLLR